MSTPLSLVAAVRTARWGMGIIALATCCGLVGGYAVTSQLTPTYQARSSVVVMYADDGLGSHPPEQRTAAGAGDGRRAFDLSLLLATVPTVAHLAGSRSVAVAVAQSLRVRPDQVVGRVEASYEPGNTIITLTASAATAEAASAMANAAADVVHEQVTQGRMVLGRRGVLAVQPLDRASPPAAPATPMPALNLALGGLLGLLVGVALVTLRAQSDTRLRTTAQIETDLDLAVLGTIPRTRHTSTGASKALHRRRIAASVRATVAALSPFADLAGRRLLVTSPTTCDAKTLAAALLGLGLAEQEFQVTVIDADLSRPRLATHFPESAGASLQRLLATDGQPQAIGHKSLRVVPAEAVPPARVRGLLSSLSFRRFVDVAASRCDVVVLNGPPVLAGADLSALVDHADSAILIVTSGSTRRSEARLAAQILSQLDIPVAGVVVANAADTGGTATPAVSGRYPAARSVMHDAASEPLPESAEGTSTAGTSTERQRRHEARSAPRW